MDRLPLRFVRLALLCLVVFPGAALVARGGSVAAAASGGALYTETNAASGNAVAVFARNADGTLTAAGTVPTGGLGTGSSLGSQGAVALGADGFWVFAVNAGDNTISSFRMTPAGLHLVSTVPSGGTLPISLSVHRRLLYVLNAGGTANISGFAVALSGKLTPLAGSTQPLSAGALAPVQVGFTPDGKVVMVTEKSSNTIDTFTVNAAGQAGAAVSTASTGTTPFGFAFGRRDLAVVSNASGGGAGAGTVSSYTVSRSGALSLVSGAVPDDQTAPCWLAVSPDARFAYTANAGSNALSGYSIAADGTLSLLTAGGATGLTGAHPTDMAFGANGQYLYSLNTGDGTVSAFTVGGDGSLTAVTGASGLPTSITGLAGW